MSASPHTEVLRAITNEPDESTLESLDDLIRKKNSQNSMARLNGGEGDRSDGLVSTLAQDGDDNPSSSVTIVPVSPSRGPPRERDESRWNGFHLWRTESYNRRAAQEYNARRTENSRGSTTWRLPSVGKRFKRAFAMGADLITPSKKNSETRSGESDGPEITSIKLFLLTIIMAGAQLAWCLEFGYGTPYLLSLGISKASTSLVWLAAPLSGMIMQPLIGVLSDLSVSQYRRRRFILISLTGLVISTAALAFSTPIAFILVDILHTGLADWDPARKEALDQSTRFIAVVSFVFLDISINSLQAAARALILDTASSSQHSRANAWHGRMTHVGNIAGYSAGWYDLSSSKLLSWLGGGQFRKYAILSLVGVTFCSMITCTFIQEAPRESAEGSSAQGFIPKIKEALYHIWQSIRRLPRPVRRICLVQLFAFMGWFPFLFYSTQWVIEIRQSEKRGGPASGPIDDEAAERGSFALLMFAIVALASGTLLPYTSLSNSSNKRAIYLSGDENERSRLAQSAEHEDRRSSKRSWRFTLRTIWTFSLVLYSVQAAILTFAVKSTDHAIVLLASIGVPWAVASWVPFALVMESVREAEDGLSPFEFEADWFAPERVRGRRESSSAFVRAQVEGSLVDCDPLPSQRHSRAESRQPSTFLARGTEIVADDTESPSRQVSTGVPMPTHSYGEQNQADEGGAESLGGTVLGIHNLAIVLPQLVVALLAAVILKSGPAQAGQGGGDSGVSVIWVIRIGGVAAFFAAILTRFVPLTRTERQMRGENVNDVEPRRFDDEVAEGEAEEEAEFYEEGEGTGA